MRLCLIAASLTGCIFASTSLYAAAQEISAEESADDHVAVMWLGDMSSSRADYEVPLVGTALEKGRAKYGGYTYTINSQILTSDRLERAFNSGDAVNIVSQPVWTSDLGEGAPTTVIPVPIARGLLGYRQLIVRKDELPRFAAVASLADLQTFTVGVGRDWVDLQILEQSGLRWQAANTTEQLLSMLARGRFDFLPLGSLEAAEILNGSRHREQLAIVPELIIYYPLPVFLQVSTNKPELAERLEYGLRKMTEDGSLEALFTQHYGDTVKRLQAERPRVIRLKNPHLPPFAEDTGPVLVQK